MTPRERRSHVRRSGFRVDVVGPAEPTSCAISSRMVSVTNINDVLDGHVGLDLDCIDRLYLNAYVPDMAVGGQVARFLTPTA